MPQARHFACRGKELTGLQTRRLLLDRYNQAVALAASVVSAWRCSS
ncbi:MAG: hypothetical protein MZW92_23785 [Comamonadaceae bacterium]|nr:hypothetical protein [Comamonadaceae bacterium]